MYIDWHTIITGGAVVSALGVLLGVVFKLYRRFLKQEDIEKAIASLKQHHEGDIKALKEENCLVCYALAACLDGLQQLGANHTVPLAREKLDKYLNQQAHEYRQN